MTLDNDLAADTATSAATETAHPTDRSGADAGAGTGPRVLIIGGSVMSGLGHRGRPIGLLTADALGATDVLDLSASGQMLRTTLDTSTDDIRRFRPDIAVLDVGGPESMVHANKRIQRLIERRAPASWHGVAGLEPRARFSNDGRKRRRQKIESWLKHLVKRGTITILGGWTKRSPEEIAADLAELFALLDELGTASVVRQLRPTDERLFPRTNAAYAQANLVIAAESARHERVALLTVAELDLSHDRHYLADHMHLNAAGHERMAAFYTTAARNLVGTA